MRIKCHTSTLLQIRLRTFSIFLNIVKFAKPVGRYIIYWIQMARGIYQKKRLAVDWFPHISCIFVPRVSIFPGALLTKLSRASRSFLRVLNKILIWVLYPIITLWPKLYCSIGNFPPPRFFKKTIGLEPEYCPHDWVSTILDHANHTIASVLYYCAQRVVWLG